ncbi:MAG TPA: metallophosphoesterase [Acidimicrobiia bacterium]|nr:metallophosphoesterase [Acidimicrobiia bacterium]
MATRTWPVPPVDQTLHCIGDFHAEEILARRYDKIIEDLGHRLVPDVLTHLQVGDQGKARAQDDQVALGFLNRLPGQWYAVCGNHDIQNDSRTPLEWAAAYGMPAANYSVDLGYAQLIVLAPDSFIHQESLAGALPFLDAELKRVSPKPAYIAAHFPLYNTVLGDPTTDWTSLQGRPAAPFFATPDADIRSVIAANSNAKAWICGHTHSRTQTHGFVKAELIGNRVIAFINASSVFYVGHRHGGQSYADPIQTLYITYQTNPERIEVRLRDHGAGVWNGFGAQRVATVTFG